MEFRLHRPAGRLARWIEYLWLARCDAGEPGVEGDQLPTGGVAILWNLGPPQALLDERGRATWFDGAWVCGERTCALRLASPRGAHLVGAQARPGAAGGLLGAPLRVVAERIVDLAAFWPDADDVRERLALAPSDDARFAELERELLRRVESAELDVLVERAVDALRRRGPGASVRGVADDLGLSHRHLRRAFAERVGIGPKTLHRVLRFQRVIAATERFAAPRWTAVATACGYFDQAHLNRDFRAFAGMTPGAYVARRSVDPNFAADAG
jgi:AraC-like DNA-binding protein